MITYKHTWGCDNMLVTRALLNDEEIAMVRMKVDDITVMHEFLEEARNMIGSLDCVQNREKHSDTTKAKTV